MDGSDHSMLFNDSEQVGNDSSDCEEDRGADCEDVQSKTLKVRNMT